MIHRTVTIGTEGGRGGKLKQKQKTISRLFNHNLFRLSKTRLSAHTGRAATDPSSVVSLELEFFFPRDKSKKLKNQINKLNIANSYEIQVLVRSRSAMLGGEGLAYL